MLEKRSLGLMYKEGNRLEKCLLVTKLVWIMRVNQCMTGRKYFTNTLRFSDESKARVKDKRSGI